MKNENSENMFLNNDGSHSSSPTPEEDFFELSLMEGRKNVMGKEAEDSKSSPQRDLSNPNIDVAAGSSLDKKANTSNDRKVFKSALKGSKLLFSKSVMPSGSVRDIPARSKHQKFSSQGAFIAHDTSKKALAPPDNSKINLKRLSKVKSLPVHRVEDDEVLFVASIDKKRTQPEKGKPDIGKPDFPRVLKKKNVSFRTIIGPEGDSPDLAEKGLRQKRPLSSQSKDLSKVLKKQRGSSSKESRSSNTTEIEDCASAIPSRSRKSQKYSNEMRAGQNKISSDLSKELRAENFAEGGSSRHKKSEASEPIEFLFAAKSSQSSSPAENDLEDDLEELSDEDLELEDILDTDYLFKEDLDKEKAEEVDEETDEEDINCAETLLADTMKHQKTALIEKAMSSTPPTRKKNFAALKKLQEGTTYSNDAIEECWHSTLDNFSSSYFNSKEARMQDPFKNRKGIAMYRGIPMSTGNSKDIRSVWNLDMSDKMRVGRGVESWQQFSGCIGQFIRMNIALKLHKSPYELWKSGQLFSLVTSRPAVECFLNYFSLYASAGTVMNRANCLLRLIRHAEIYYRKQNNSDKVLGKLMGVHAFLQQKASANKSEARRISSCKRHESSRAASGHLITPEVFEELCEKSKTACDEMRASVLSAVKNSKTKGDNPQEAANTFVQGREGLVDKWCLHFLCLLILNGSGQRPQVFTFLKSMNDKELRNVFLKTKDQQYPLEIQIAEEEKVMRDLAAPCVMLPPSLTYLLIFHIKVMLPILYFRHDICEDDARRNYLFLHTGTGDLMISSNITSSLRTFLISHDPALGAVTTMTVRSCYCSMMLKRYYNRQEFNYIPLKDFLRYLAKVMNTSEEQIRRTYASIVNDEPYRKLVCEVLGILSAQPVENTSLSSVSS